MDLNVLVEEDRTLKFDERTNGVEIFTGAVDLPHVVIGQRAEIFRYRGVEIRQVVRIENDFLPVHFRVTDAERPGKTEVGLRQCSALLARVDDPGHTGNDLILFDTLKARS